MKRRLCIFGWCLVSLSLVSLMICGCASQKKIGPGRKRGESADELVVFLMNRLSDPSVATRVDAADRLGRMGKLAQEAAPMLVKRLADRNRQVSRHARLALIQLGDYAVPALTEALDDEDYRIRHEAKLLRNQIIVASFEKGETLSSQESMALTANAAHNATIEILLGWLNDGTSSDRALAASTLGNMGPAAKSAFPALTAALDDESKMVCVNAAEALVKIDASSVNLDTLLPPLVEAMFDEDGYVSTRAVRILRRLTPDAWKNWVHLPGMGTGGKDWRVRAAGISRMGQIGDPTLVPALILVLEDVRGRLRRQAVEALVQIGAPAVPALIAASLFGTKLTRWHAVEALEKIGTPEAMKAIEDRGGNQ